MQSLSVLIPTYNDVCVALVEQLLQLLQAANIQYEVIVADDGSTDEDIIAANRAINQLPSCRFIERQMNVGRAAIRNFLAMEARFSYILFIDSDMTIISDQYIQRYLQVGDTTVIDGGVTICDTNDASNLRYLYEKAEEPHHTATERQKCPYQHLHTANLFMQRDIILAHPFDEIHIPLILSLIRFWHRLFKKAERRNLCGSRPSLWIFKLYRLGYFLCLK